MNTNSEEIRITGDYTQARKLVLKSIITRGTRTIKRTEGGTLKTKYLLVIQYDYTLYGKM